MELRKILHEDDILIPMQADSKEEAIRQLAEMLVMLLSKRIEIIINMKKLKAATVKRSTLYQRRHSVNLLQTHSFIEHGI